MAAQPVVVPAVGGLQRDGTPSREGEGDSIGIIGKDIYIYMRKHQSHDLHMIARLKPI